MSLKQPSSLQVPLIPVVLPASIGNLPLLLGSGSAGFLEIAIFHPVDTIAKRLMSCQKKLALVGGGSVSAGTVPLSEVLFGGAYGGSALSKVTSLFPGLGYATGYKVLQRVYKFGGQPIVNDFVFRHFGHGIANIFGEKNKKPMCNAVAGALIGIGEVAILPLDVLKIKSQTNPDALKGRGILDIIRKERFGLYRGGMWTAARNAPGSFALFGASALTKEYVFGLENYNKASFFQNTISSVMGAFASLVVSNPLDVVKTRIQNKHFDRPESGTSIVKNILKNEGPTAFFKGLAPKLLVVGPKLVFSFTIAQSLIQFFANLNKE